MKLIVGLGNYGEEYASHRHNIGFMLLDKLAKSFSLDERWGYRSKGLYHIVRVGEKTLYLLKPRTYMNLSGESLRPFLNFYKISLEDLLVVHDDIDLQLGAMIFKEQGGFGGHKGLKSIGEQMGTANFKRLRLGIGRPISSSVSDWVLSSFDERDSVENIVTTALEAVLYCIEKGFDEAYRNLNHRKVRGV